MFKIDLKANGGSVEINKLDKDTGTNVAQGNTTLKSAKYEILDMQKQHVAYLTTDENGKFKTDRILKFNTKYILKETEASTRYELGTNEYEIIVTNEKSRYKNRSIRKSYRKRSRII